MPIESIHIHEQERDLLHRCRGKWRVVPQVWWTLNVCAQCLWEQWWEPKIHVCVPKALCVCTQDGYWGDHKPRQHQREQNYRMVFCCSITVCNWEQQGQLQWQRLWQLVFFHKVLFVFWYVVIVIVNGVVLMVLEWVTQFKAAEAERGGSLFMSSYKQGIYLWCGVGMCHVISGWRWWWNLHLYTTTCD